MVKHLAVENNAVLYKLSEAAQRKQSRVYRSEDRTEKTPEGRTEKTPKSRMEKTPEGRTEKNCYIFP